MTYTFSLNELRFASASAAVEAYRRALEIRQHARSEDHAGLSLVCPGLEVYVWKTPLERGQVEVETVSVDTEEGTLTYELQLQKAS